MSLDEQIGINTQENASRDIKPSNRRLIMTLIIGSIVLIISAVFIFQPKKAGNVPKSPIITPPVVIVTTTPPPFPSRLASDSGVLKMEIDNLDLNNRIVNTDLVESPLALPNVDMNVDFQK